MSERPPNQGSQPFGDAGDEDFPSPPRPEQIWPPPLAEEAADAVGKGEAEPIDLGWADHVERINDAIEEIGRIEEETPPIAAAPTTSESVRGAAAPPQVVRACHIRARSEAELGQLWSNIFLSIDPPSPKTIVVAAARRRDGATQIAAALAMIGAEANLEMQIALVDLNLRNPQLHKTLGISHQPALGDVLSGRASLDAAIQRVSVKGGGVLNVLVGGSAVEQPLGLLKSRQMKGLIARLKDRFDHVIFDVANASRHPDAQVLGAMADGVLLVVRAGDTPRETVSEVKKRLDLAGVRCLGLVLNQRSDPIPDLVYRMT